MTDAEMLIGSVNDAEGFLRSLGAFPSFNRYQTGVAITALFAAGFIEISEEGMAPASGNLAKAQHRIEFDLLNALVLLGPLRLP